MKLSVIIPCYNEEKTIKIIIERVLKFKELEKEIIIIDDCSTDNSKSIISELSNINPEIKAIHLLKNYGKGFALKKGFEEVSGDIVLIQDADLEYDPKDYSALIKPFKNTDADVVYSLQASDVKDVFVSGKQVVKNGILVNSDLNQITNKASEFISKWPSL